MYEKPRLERYGSFQELARLTADPEKAARKHTIRPVLPRELPIPPVAGKRRGPARRPQAGQSR